jgi:thiol-disulfide isomerase/thioredoxin
MKPTKIVAAAMLVTAFAALVLGFGSLSVGEPANLFNLQAATARTPAMLPSFNGANEWLNSPPLAADALKGKVVLVQFWTYSCVNWLRTLPYVRAWADKYKDQGFVVVGVHTPEFEFEKKHDNIVRAMQSMRIAYPVAVDSDYAIWRAFGNEYWPSLYLIDAQGKVRHIHNGEGDYEETERVLRKLLVEAGKTPPADALVSVAPRGIEVSADLATLQSPETYVGHARAWNFASRGGVVADSAHVYTAPAQLGRNQWALSGDWTIGRQITLSNRANAAIVYAFHARDVNLVMGPATGAPIRFRVRVDGREPGADHGEDVDAQGNGVLDTPRLYQLVRQRAVRDDRRFEIEFLDAGAQAYSFTFG